MLQVESLSTSYIMGYILYNLYCNTCHVGNIYLHLTKDNLRSCIPSHCSYYSNERVVGVWHQLVLNGEGKCHRGSRESGRCNQNTLIAVQLDRL